MVQVRYRKQRLTQRSIPPSHNAQLSHALDRTRTARSRRSTTRILHLRNMEAPVLYPPSPRPSSRLACSSPSMDRRWTVRPVPLASCRRWMVTHTSPFHRALGTLGHRSHIRLLRWLSTTRLRQTRILRRRRYHILGLTISEPTSQPGPSPPLR